MKLRPVILVLSAVAVVLLGLQQVGTYLLIPGGDTGFEAKVLPSRQLQLTSDVGDLAEIARQLRLPYSTVAVRMFRLLRKLRSEAERFDPNP